MTCAKLTSLQYGVKIRGRRYTLQMLICEDVHSCYISSLQYCDGQEKVGKAHVTCAKLSHFESHLQYGQDEGKGVLIYFIDADLNICLLHQFTAVLPLLGL